MKINKDCFIFTLIGIIIGMLITVVSGIAMYKIVKSAGQHTRYEEPGQKIKKELPVKQTVGFTNFYLSFEKSDDLYVLDAGETSIEISESHSTHGKHSLMTRIRPGSEYPGLTWEVYGRTVQNWSHAESFHFDVYNNTENSVNLEVKFKSGKEYPKKSYSTTVALEPLKMNTISIPMESIADYCDLTQMSYIKFFVSSPQKEIVLYFDNMGIRQGTQEDEKTVPISSMKTPQKIQTPTGIIRDKEEIFIASSLDRIFQDGKTLIKPSFTQKAEVQLAQNEYESFQVVVANGKNELKDVRLEIDLPDGKVKANWRKVGYVPTKKPYYQVKFVGLWPDPLLPAAKTDITPGITQPFWVTIYAPNDTSTGAYQGKIKVIANGEVLKELPLIVKIWNFALPLESHLKTAFDFYGHLTSKQYPKKENESEASYTARIAEINEKFIVNMLQHRMNPILNIDPSSQEDLGKIDHYRKYGLNNFAIGKKGGTFNNNWPSEDEEIEKLLPVYRGYAENLKYSKMIEYTYIYTWDESKINDPVVSKICSMIHRAYPGLKNMVCYHGFWEPEKNPDWGKDIDIWCFGIGDYNETKVKTLRDRGMEMWMYISGPGNPREPNLAIDFDSMAYRIVPWLCLKYDLKGFLYWCVNFWPYVDPYANATNTKWEQNGNGLLFYPGENGPVDSIRAEIYRDGMEDYEYFYLLAEIVKKIKDNTLDRNNSELLKKADDLLKIDNSIAKAMNDYTINPDIILKRRIDVAETILKLNIVLTGQSSKQESAVKENNLVTEDFSQPVEAINGKSFGKQGQLTFELYRGGTFIIDGKSGYAWQKSDSYRDSAIIRSTTALPKTYKISVIAGEIDYGLDKIAGLQKDPEYTEGPLNENGCYLLAITDEAPTGHHTNDWWHQHRKVCIDVDNNVMGNGMPNPVFMIFFDKENRLMAINGDENKWSRKWAKAISYKPGLWYRIEVEKTETSYNLNIYNMEGTLLKGGVVPLRMVWNEDVKHPDYLVIGDPHENYYQGSMKIKSITLPIETK